MDVVEPGELVVVEQEGGRVQDQLRGGPGQEKMVMMKKMTITTWSASPSPSWRGPRCQGPPSHQTPFRDFAD